MSTDLSPNNLPSNLSKSPTEQLRGFYERLAEKLRAVPLLVALVPMVAGVACGTWFGAPFYVWAAACVICGVAAAPALRQAEGESERYRSPANISKRGGSKLRTWLDSGFKPDIATLYTMLAVLFFGATVASFHAPHPVVSQGERVWMEVEIRENPVRSGGRSMRTSGVVVRWRPGDPQPDNDWRPNRDRQSGNDPQPDNSWQPSGEKLSISFDTMYRFSAGDRVVFRGYVNPVSDSVDSYSRLMAARGFTGRTYISQFSRPYVLSREDKSSKYFFANLQHAATERLQRLDGGIFAARESATPETAADKKSDEIAIAAAMTTGDRGGITRKIREAYSRTGAAHLLAVSGLHVGIVFLLINALLYFLPLARRGHIVKNIVAIVAIWLYAALTGMSPSVTRAAFMFTGAQAALAMSQSRNAINIMCGTALVMLSVKPGLLFDISFQLSFIAVAAIMSWFRPIYSLVESRWRGLNALWATLIVGLTASVATMPLVSHTFGVTSPAGIVLNPIVILTAHLVVVFSLLWIIAPIPFLEPVFRWLVGGPAWLQNSVIETVAKVPGTAIEWTMPLWMVLTIYGGMIIFTAWLAARPRKKEPFSLLR